MLRNFLNNKRIYQVKKLLEIKNNKRIIEFEIYRYRGGCSKPYIESFKIDTKNTPMILDCLLKIKNEIDPTLTIRRSCREGICGSCSMNIGGLNTLACLCTLEESITPDGKIRIYPLPHQQPIKDLVVDMNRFYEHHKSIKPWLHISKEKEISKKELYQSIDDRNKLDGLYECILCSCCSASCPSYWWHGKENYLGPAILLQAFRWIIDSRDMAKNYRLQLLSENKEKVL